MIFFLTNITPFINKRYLSVYIFYQYNTEWYTRISKMNHFAILNLQSTKINISNYIRMSLKIILDKKHINTMINKTSDLSFYLKKLAPFIKDINGANFHAFSNTA